MKIEKLKLADLVLDPANARKHSPKNLDAIKGSLKRFGQQKPIVVDKKNVVIAGNGTVMAAKDLGWSEIEAFRTKLEGYEAMAFAIFFLMKKRVVSPHVVTVRVYLPKILSYGRKSQLERG